jgi:hypothetical protein
MTRTTRIGDLGLVAIILASAAGMEPWRELKHTRTWFETWLADNST